MICDAIKNNTKLQVFDISFNNIGGVKDMALAECLNHLFLN